MGMEIERKFLLRNDTWRRSAVSCSLLRQAYAHFQGNPNLTFRVRLADDRAFLTLKGPVSGCSRKEFEYPIPAEDAKNLLDDFCGKEQIEKVAVFLKGEVEDLLLVRVPVETLMT